MKPGQQDSGIPRDAARIPRHGGISGAPQFKVAFHLTPPLMLLPARNPFEDAKRTKKIILGERLTAHSCVNWAKFSSLS